MNRNLRASTTYSLVLFAVLAIIFTLLWLIASPVDAQDATREPVSTPIATLEATPLVTPTPAPVMVSSGGGAVTINTGGAPTASTTSASTDSATPPFTYLAFGGLVVICVVLLFNIPILLRIVAPLIPAEQATFLLKSMIPMIADALLKTAAETPTPFDEGLILAALRQQGYTVTTLVDGAYHVEGPKTAPATDTTKGTGAPLGGGAFPYKSGMAPAPNASDPTAK